MAEKSDGEFKIFMSRTLNQLGQVMVLVAIPAHNPLDEYYVFLSGATRAMWSGRLEPDSDNLHHHLVAPSLDSEAATETALAYVRIRWPEILESTGAGHVGSQLQEIELQEVPSPQRGLTILHSIGFREEFRRIMRVTYCHPLQSALESFRLRAALAEERDFHEPQ